jgi:hypothetical protein
MREPTDQDVFDYAEAHDVSMLDAREMLRAEINTPEGQAVDYRAAELAAADDQELTDRVLADKSLSRIHRFFRD